VARLNFTISFIGAGFDFCNWLKGDKKMKMKFALTVIGVTIGFYTLPGDDRTPPPAPNGSSIETQLRIDVKDDVDTVHLISTDNDPDIVTKTYILKNADPYEVKPYLRSAVRAERINGNAAKIEAIKFNDGTGALIVSAEDYKFNKLVSGDMTIDEIVEGLDKPDLKSTSGKKAFAYFPKYWDANSLANVVRNVGLSVPGDPFELDGGSDSVGVDSDLNAVLFYCPLYQVKNIKKALELYDTPTSEVNIKYAVYELDTESDDKLGVDFQSWKNGPGADIFSAAGRFSNGWSADAISGLPDGTNFNETKFFKFNPRWNTRYIDFLAAKGKANVITTGEISIMNGLEGRISSTIEAPLISGGEAIPNIVSGDYITLEEQTFVAAGTLAAAGNTDSYRITARDENGRLITTDDFVGSLVITRVNDGNRTTYFIKVFSGGDAILVNGKRKRETKCFNLVLEQSVVRRNTNDNSDTNTAGAAMPNDWAAISSWQTDKNMTVYRSATRNTAGNSYGFELRITPSVNELTTSASITMANTSLIGFSSDGTARISTSGVTTVMSMPNSGARLVVGGVEKISVVKSVSKIPWLGDIPGLGWLFSSESQSSKKTQLVAVIDCAPLAPDQKLPDGVIKEKEEFVKTKSEGGSSLPPGYDQLLIDSDKKTFDPLP
jgi:type II secretory pathway component GspD/PulD (secretin)